MNRRRFLRIVGGGIVVAAGASASGCSDSMPSAAIAPWQHPAGDLDVRRWILSYAILAPHSHNLQSWLVDLRNPDEILLRVDPARLLPETDPFSRQIVMSHGTFLELLDLAARERGLRADITAFPEGEFGPDAIDERPVARIRLTPDPAVARDPLFASILTRRTNRSAYALDRGVPVEAWDAMRSAATRHPLRFDFVQADQPELLGEHRAIALDAWRIELTTPAAILESYKVLRVGASEIARHRDGLSLTDPKVVLLERLGLFDRSKAPAPDDYAVTSQVDDFRNKLESTPAFLWMITRGNDRAAQLDAGRAYARVQLAATAHGISMQPLQQALQEYPEQAGPYAGIHRLLGARSPEETVQMWARVGYAPPVQPAPRRGLDAQLV